jgi:hypothetical protein
MCFISNVANFIQEGFVNSMVFSNSGRFLIAGIGREHKFGRWESIPTAKNGLRFIPLPSEASSADDMDGMDDADEEEDESEEEELENHKTSNGKAQDPDYEDEDEEEEDDDD